MASLSWMITLQVAGSPAISVAKAPFDVSAMDYVEALIAPGDSDKVLAIQPSALAAVHLLVVKSSSYGAHLSFKASDGAADFGRGHPRQPAALLQ